MMWTLNTFYRSKEWVDFRQIVIDKRLNEDGLSVCEHCGKPIVKAYDLILHHKEELTEENVNDVNVSLNEENIMIVHFGCHNKIHDRFGLNKTRKVYIVYGPPLSGKTTWVNEVKCEGDLIIDIDSIWQCISGCNRYVKPNRLKSNAFGVRDALIDMVKYRRGKWLNAYIIGGYPLVGERQRLSNMLGAEEVFIECSKDICIERLVNDDSGRDKKIWLKFIEEWFEKNS